MGKSREGKSIMGATLEPFTIEDLAEKESLSCSDRECEGCAEPLAFGDPCVMLRLMCPVRDNGEVVLLDAVESDGSYMADPLIYCASCWEGYNEDMWVHRDDLLLAGQKAGKPSPLRCAHCQVQIGWGNCVTQVVHGELDTSPRTLETTFRAANEDVSRAELICMNCLGSLNDICDESIWTHLWEED